jgi:hypothetical protein
MGYSESYRTGYETSGRNGQNPFKGALNEITEARKRREAEDLKRQDEDRRLHDLFSELDKRSDLDMEKEYTKGEIEGNLKRRDPLAKTPVSSIPNAAMSLADGGVGDMQGNKIAEGVIQQAGLSQRTLRSPKGIEYEVADSPKRQLEQENLKYMQNVNKSMGTGDGADLVYRKADTGEEVSKQEAESAIAKGDRNYIINQRVTTKAGVKESPLIKAPDLTQDEKQYTIAADRISKSLGNLTDKFPKLYEKKGSPLWKSMQIQNVPFALIGDKDIQDLKSSLNMVKADIPFLRGGKQLTDTEAKRIDILLNPMGKSPDIYKRDIKQFQDEFMGGKELMVGGVSAMSRQKEEVGGVEDFSQMSDEQLRAIANE